ncbi:MAG: hypothetical protein OEY52_08405 [Gammaproteobacteria bacterium]|nr:hypothetical protein [Gammaproteobacteria bacterium]
MKIVNLAVLIMFSSMFSACSSDDAAAGGAGTTAGLLMHGESGTKVNVNGEWASPCSNTSPGTSDDSKTILVFSGSSLMGYAEKYTSKDTSCTGTATRFDRTDYYTTATTKGLTLTLNTEKAVLGWQNSSVDTVAPDRKSGGALPNTPTVTTASSPWYFSDTSGDQRWVFYIDDSDAANGNYVLYKEERPNVSVVHPSYLDIEPFTKKK